MSEDTTQKTLDRTAAIEEQRDKLLVRSNPELGLWFTYYDTPAEMVKQASIGSYKFSTVDATFTRFRMTALWGPYGQKWGLRNLRFEFTKEADGRLAEMVLHAEFFYPGNDGKEVSFELINDWPWRRAGETAKKLQTNTVNKALAYLGVSCDLWDGKFEEDPYLEYQDAKGPLAAAEKADDIILKVRNAPPDKLEPWYSAACKRGLNKHNFMKLEKAYNARKLEHETAFMFGGSDDAEKDHESGVRGSGRTEGGDVSGLQDPA